MVWTPPDGLSMPEWWCRKSLQEASMNQVSTVGLDLAKSVFQLHGADSAGAVVFRKKLRRGQVLTRSGPEADLWLYAVAQSTPCGSRWLACTHCHFSCVVDRPPRLER